MIGLSLHLTPSDDGLFCRAEWSLVGMVGGRHERAKRKWRPKARNENLFLFRGGRIAIFLKDKFVKMATPWSKNHQVDDKIPPYKKKCTAA